MTVASTKSFYWYPSMPKLVFALTLIAVSLLQNDLDAQTPVPLPDFPAQVMLIKNTIVAVNHGNLTGNYTVLRDLTSEKFRQRNKASDLAETFVNLRKQKFDLSPILVNSPQLTQRPAQDQHGRLQLVGFFPTRPQAVQFTLIFQHIQGGWVIDEISLSITPLETIARTYGVPQAAPQGLPPAHPRVAQRPSGNVPPGTLYR